MNAKELTEKYPLPEPFKWARFENYTSIHIPSDWSHWWVWVRDAGQYRKGDAYAQAPGQDKKKLANIPDLDEACQFIAHKALFGLYE